ncbi:MAG TPA: formate dehydrogenase accessory sulfurtransferase FdhD [Gaiellaceae bacterium]
MTGILLVGGASTRFGSPKALACLDGETLAERAWRLLGDCCDLRIAVGKIADGLALPFPVVDDDTEVRAPLAGLVAGLRSAPTDLCVVVPVDCVSLTPDALRRLAGACDGHDAAVPSRGPLPGAYRKRALPVLERRLAAGELRLRDGVDELAAARVELPDDVLANLNRAAELAGASPTASQRATARVRVARGDVPGDLDAVAVEEPLEIRIDGEPVAVTMRTPGHDEELALGFALGEGLEPIHAAPTDDLAANTVDLRVRAFDPDRLRRHFYTSSSCGVCGKGALDAVAVSAPPVTTDISIDVRALESLPGLLGRAQPVFAATGGLHGAGLFDHDCTLICAREDVGRHNALDKVIGWAFRSGLVPLDRRLLCVTGRLSFELVQKAALAGCGFLVGVGAPSSLAVQLAETQGITLCGFAREDHVNVYAHPERVRFAPQARASSARAR